MMIGRKEEPQRGVIVVLVAVALLALLGMAALAVDVGRLVLAAQVAQDVADATALAGASQLPDKYEVRQEAEQIIQANNHEITGYQTELAGDSGIVYYEPGEPVPGYGAPGSNVYGGIRVTVRIPITYIFASVLGLEGATVTRSSTVVLAPAGGEPILPMWISHEPILEYGKKREMLMASDPDSADIPGSFGWLEPPSGASNEFLDLLRGYNLTPRQLATNGVVKGDILTAYTGLTVGQWRRALDRAPHGLARLQRATWQPWTYDTFESYHTDNPRLVIVPMVKYVGGVGTGARFEVIDFGAFWIEKIDSQKPPYTITGCFIEYKLPGAGGEGFRKLKMVK